MKAQAAAQLARNLANDQTYMEIMAGVREKQTAVFLNTQSSSEDIEEAHAIVRALEKIDDHIRSLHNAAVVEMKRESVP